MLSLGAVYLAIKSLNLRIKLVFLAFSEDYPKLDIDVINLTCEIIVSRFIILCSFPPNNEFSR